MGKNKQPRAAVVPQTGKVPRVEADPERSIHASNPRWSFARVDGQGKWGWHQLDTQHVVDMLKRLAAFETMTWGEIERTPSCGSIEVSAVCSEAQARLRAIGMDQVDALFKLRITQARRVWGVRRGTTFLVLWWDPEHSVYPMNIANN